MEKAKEIAKSIGNSKIQKVGVFVNESQDAVNKAIRLCGLDIVQFHGNETEEYCRMFDIDIIKAFRIKANSKNIFDEIKEYKTSYVMLDTYSENFGGTGKRFDWKIAKEIMLKRKVFLAGGINEANIEEAIALRPYAVDVCRGVESCPGKKDPDKMRTIIEKVKKG